MIHLGWLLGLEVARSTLCRAMKRLADKAEPIYDGLVEKIRGSPVVYSDETGWKVGVGGPATSIRLLATAHCKFKLE